MSKDSFAGPWWPGSLLPYESMCSLGAKYCWFSAIHPIEFLDVMAEFTPAFTRRNPYRPDIPAACAVDVPGFRLVEFANLIGERAQLLQTQSLAALGADQSVDVLRAAATVRHSPFWVLRVCAKCIASGYHSVVHQIDLMKHCFIHPDQPLVELPHMAQLSLKGLSIDLRHVTRLHRAWFGADPAFPLKGMRAKLSEQELEQGDRAVQRVRRLVERSIGGAKGTAVAARVALNEEDVAAGIALPESMQKDIGRVGMRSLVGSRWASADTVKVSLPDPAMATLLGDRASEWVVYFCVSRLVSVVINGCKQEPDWLTLAHDERRKMLMRHYGCSADLNRVLARQDCASAVALLAGSAARRDKGELPVRLEEGLLRQGLLPCRRLMSIRWCDELFRDDGEALSQAADDLERGRFSPVSGQPMTSLAKPMVDAGLCTRLPLRKRELLGNAEADRLGISQAWGHLLRVRARPYFSGVNSSGAGQVFAPCGTLLEVVDQVLMVSVRTIFWVLLELEEQPTAQNHLDQPSADSPTALLLERLEKSAPYTALNVFRSTLTASSFCQYPAGVPVWNKPTAAVRDHKSATAIAMARLENALREVVLGRRSMVFALTKGRPT